ncbi:MAG: hypothetical protein ACJAVS_000504 [Paracoccaceae bacterium]|jgi:hypothetical protein
MIDLELATIVRGATRFVILMRCAMGVLNTMPELAT